MNVVKIVCAIVMFFTPFFVYAQEVPTEEQSTENPIIVDVQPEIRADAGGDQNIAKGRKVVFSASGSVITGLNEDDVEYRWDLGDGEEKEGNEIVHEYQSPGFYRVVLTISSGEYTDTDEVIISVYDNLALVVTDKAKDDQSLLSLKRYAARQGVLLVEISTPSSETETITESNLVQGLVDAQKDVKDADVIVVWTARAGVGLNVLSTYGSLINRGENDLISSKPVVVITEQSQSVVGRIAQSAYAILRPTYILLTKEDALEVVIDAQSADRVLAEVRDAQIEHTLIGDHSVRAVSELGPTNFLSYALNFLINRGVSLENITLLLLLPIIATCIALIRQVFGLKTFGIYIPSLLSITFVVTGIKYGLFIFVVLLVIATLLRMLMSRINILYLPRMALVLSMTAFAIIALYVIGSLTGRTGIIELSIFPILILVIIIEKFLEVQIEKGFKSSLKLTLWTIFVSVGVYYAINAEVVKTFIIAYPETVLLVIPVGILIGKWSGLRISEYFRFREVAQLAEKK